MNVITYNATGLPINWKDLNAQLIARVKQMKLKGIDIDRAWLCAKADVTYSWVLLATRRNTMRIKTINKLKKVGINVKIIK